MHFWRGIALFFLACGAGIVMAQAPATSPETLSVTTQLVVLDATVLDKAGRVVTQPLTRDDFQIEENKKPQEIYSFESVAEHSAAAASGDAEKSPRLIFVLDELDYPYQLAHTSSWNTIEQLNEEKFERDELMAYLRKQPETLREPAEVLILTHHGYRILVQPTRDRDVLMDRVSQHDPGLGSPYRDVREEALDLTSTKASLQAVWSLAMQQRGRPGRKIVIWLGVGGPRQHLSGRPVDLRHMVPAQRYQEEITNMLIDARITLDVLGPSGDVVAGYADGTNAALQGGTAHYESDFGFAGYISATGGRWKNGNDIRGEIEDSENYGTLYYTMSYRPANHSFDGEFRRIRVTVKGHPEWTVLTKAGYYALQFGGEKDYEHQVVSDLSIATFEAMPFSSIGATLMQIDRIKGTDSARFTFRLDSSDLQWHTDAMAKVREADIGISGAALGSELAKGPLASEAATWKLTLPLNNEKLPAYSSASVIVRVPPKTKRMRFAVRDLASGRMGTVDLNPAAVATAPEIDAPTTALQPRKPAQ
jgi:VWFA-related protein